MSLQNSNKQIKKIWFIWIFCICSNFFLLTTETNAEETKNINSISKNSLETNISSETISVETESNAVETISIEVKPDMATLSEETNTLAIWYSVPGVQDYELKNTVFYIDGTAYQVTANVIVLNINPSDTSIHTVYAVSEGHPQSKTKSFSFSEMPHSDIMILSADSQNNNISYVTGVLKLIDFLNSGKMHMEDGRTYDYDPDLIVDERGLRGKTILCTLQDGIVIDFKEYTATDSAATDIEANKYENSYGKEKKPLTPKDKVYNAAKEYNSAMNNYFNSLGQTASKALKRKNSTSQDKGKQLRAIDEAKGANRMLTVDPNMPNDAINSAYAALSDFLDMYTETGVELGKIKLSEKNVEIEARIVNQIINNIDTNGLSRRKYGNYYVKISAVSIWGNYTGSVVVEGKGRIYHNIINSNTKEVAQTMNDYLNELSDLTKDLENQALQAIINEFIKSSYIGDITKSEIRKLFKNKIAYIKKYGFGEGLIDISNDILEDYQQAKAVLELKDIDGFDDAMVNARTLHKKLESKDYTFEDKFGTGGGSSCPIIEDAIKRLDKARKNFMSALSDYLYNTDLYDAQENNLSWNTFFKVFINCPVDFEIYDRSANCIAYYKDGKISSNSSSVHIELIGDKKVIYISSAASYINNIKLTATDYGEMDYIVEKYVNGVSTERANYYHIPLTDGSTFTQNANWNDLSSLTTQNALVSNSGAEITADEYFAVTDDAVINVASTANAGGKTVGDGTYIKGDTVALSAIAEEGYHFDGWYMDGTLADSNTTYYFTAAHDVNLEARFISAEIQHPDYKAVIGREYSDFAGVSVYKNKKADRNIDIILKLENEAYSSAYDTFKVKGYLKDNQVFEKIFITDIKDQSNIRLNNIDIKENEHIEIYDSNDVAVAYIVYVPDYQDLDDLVISSDTKLDGDIYCDNLTINADLDLNGHNLIVTGDVTGKHTFDSIGKITNLTTVSVTNGTMKVLGNIDAMIDIELNHGKFVEYSQINMDRGGLSLSYDDDRMISYGDVVYARSDGEIIAGSMEFYGNVSFSYAEMHVAGTNEAIFCGAGQQIIHGSFNDVLLENENILPDEFFIKKLLSNVKVDARKNEANENGSVEISIEDSNGYSIEIEGDIEDISNSYHPNAILCINGGRCTVNGDIRTNLCVKNNGMIDINGNFEGMIDNIFGNYENKNLSLDNGRCSVSGNVSTKLLKMVHESDLLDIEGDLIRTYDSVVESGTIRLAGNLYTGLSCTGNNKFIFDGNSQQRIESSPHFNDVVFNNGNCIYADDNFGFVNLLSDLTIKFDSSWIYINNESAEADLHGHKLILEPESSDYAHIYINGKYNLSGGDLEIIGAEGAETDTNLNGTIINLSGGTLKTDGDLELYYGSIIDINQGKLIVKGDLYNWCYGEKGITSLIIMENDKDLMEIEGNFSFDATPKTISYNNKMYSICPQSANEYPSISAGTIKFHGDVSAGELSFEGTNSVIFCGDQYQEIGGCFNQTQVINPNISFSGRLGNLLSDAVIRNHSSLGDETNLNGFSLIFDGGLENEGLIVVDGGKLEINDGLVNVGTIHVLNDGQIHISGYYDNLPWDDCFDNGTIILDSANAILDVDDDFYFYNPNSSGDFEMGTIRLSGDAYFYGQKDFLIGADVILDGNTPQIIECENGCKFNKLFICQPLTNYTFKPNPCWNILLDANGNVIDTQQYDKTEDTQPAVNPLEPPKTEYTPTTEIGQRVSINNAQYKVVQHNTNELSVVYEKCENKKAASVNIPSSVVINGATYKVTSIEKNAFKNNKTLKKITIGKNIEKINRNAFYGCNKLSKVIMGNNVLSIDDKAFYKCSSLKRITIPSKVGKIGKQAFYGCKNLKSITIKTTKLTKKNVGSKAFQGIHAKATIHVPKKKLESYKKLLKKKGINSQVKIK